MADGISRRDFLNGVPLVIGASPLQALAAGAPYPPAKTGLRGSHDGAWETMHERVGGRSWPVGKPEETYDLVVVGAGISGLSAAHFYRAKNPKARVLLLDNHDDFGGHAKRNELSGGGITRIGYGGTESLDTPSAYSDVARQLLKDLGVELQQFYTAYDQQLYAKLGLSKAIVFDAETFGERRLVTGYGKRPWEEFAALAPLTAKARADFIRVQTEKKDYLPGLSQEERRAKLRNVSYEAYLRDWCKVDPQVIEIYRKWGISFWCVGIDEIRATSVHSYDGGMPGLDYTLKRSGSRGDEPYIFHFPDGNASVARLLVRSLLPSAVPGTTMEDVVTARVKYELLDRKGSPVRLRLSSTAVQVAHTADQKAVDVTYVNAGKPHTVRAGHVVLACYNMAIPYLCPELPEEQKKGLAHGVKIPLTYTKVLVPNWRAFAEQGIDFVYYTKDFFKQVELDYPVTLGKHRRSQTPDEPMVLHMCHVHHGSGHKGAEQWREGRRRLLATPFSVFEHHVKDQLDQALKGAGFDAERDVKAITVNRWAHGYAYPQGNMWDPVWEEGQEPWVKGRQPFGRVFVANSDAAAEADTGAAITQAHRAVSEALGG